jgi:peptidyl-prolyl cis-trans isomerase D
MLDSFRKKNHNIIWTLLLLSTVAVMAFYGFNQVNPQGGGRAGAAAWVNGEAIPMREYAQELEYRKDQYRNMLGAQFDDKLFESFQVPQRTLEEMIEYKLLAQQATKLNFRVPDGELIDRIKSIPYYQKDGVFDAALYTSLPNRGLEEQRERERMLLVRMQGYLVDRVRTTPAELHDAYQLRETKVDLDYAKIDFNELASQQKPSASQLAEFIKKTPDADFKAYYDSHQNDFKQKAAANIRQIRVSVPFQAKDAVKADAKKKITAIAQEVTPKNFSQVARKSSDDEYAKKGGAVGWVTRGTLEHALEAAIDQLEVGKVSQPIETTFGYYLLMVDGKRTESVQSLAEAKTKIAEALLVEKTKHDFTDKTKAELDKSLAAGQPLDAALKRFKIEIKKTGPFALGQGNIPNVGNSDGLVDAVAELTPAKPVAKQLVFSQGSYYYFKLRSVTPPKAAEFAKNADSLDGTIAKPVQSALLGKWMETLKKSSTINIEVPFPKAAANPLLQRS